MHLLVVAFLLLCTIAHTQSLTTKVLTTEARELLRQGNSTVTKALLGAPSRFIDEPLWREAINYGLAAKQAAPTSAEPYGFLGKVYSYVNFYDASWDAYTSFRALGGVADDRQREQMIYLGRKLGYEFFARSEFESALEYYLVAYHYAPTDQEINLQIARSYLGTNQAGLAATYLRQLDAQPSNTQHSGDYSRYLETATDHLFYGQAASDAFERGIAEYYLGNLGSARDSFAEAARLEPTFQKAFVWAGRVSLELSEPDAALPYWQGAQALTPDSANVQYFLGVTQEQLRWGAATYTFFERGLSLYNQGTMPQARIAFEQAASHNSSFTEAWAWLGRIAYEGADYQTAYEAFGKASQLSSDESYAYFKNASARELGLDKPEVAVVTRPTNLEQAAPVQEVKQLESISERLEVAEESQVVPVDETAQVSYNTDAPTNAAPNGVPLELLRTTYAYERDAVETNGAVSFFAAPPNIQKDWQAPVNYANGVVYQRLEVTEKPSSEAVTYQLCLVPNDDIAIKPACSRASGLEFSETGVYVFEQPLNEFYQYDNIDWSRGISNLMVILRDQNGNPVDTVFSSERGRNLDLYYPMSVRYSVVLVPAGGAFMGWP